jgi:hypothetical protein
MAADTRGAMNMPLSLISNDLAGELLADQLGGALPLLAGKADWFAVSDRSAMGAIVEEQGGTWLYALLSRDLNGTYQKLAYGKGHISPGAARCALVQKRLELLPPPS